MFCQEAKLYVLWVLTVFLVMSIMAWPAAARDAVSTKTDMLTRTEKLLDAVEGGVLTDLEEEESELREEAVNAKSQAMGDAQREAKIRAHDEAMHEKADALRSKIQSWSTGGEDLVQSLSSDELNEAMAEARKIAKYFGLDVENLGKLYELGKKTIKQHEFVLPNAMPPDKDESYSRYFSDFFTFAHNREEELNKYRKEQQEYRATLFKRVTLAYIRALLAATEKVPPCNKTEPTKTVTIEGQTLQSFGCKDPVVENLRTYVQAVQKIASADSDRFMAEAEVELARQELTTDLAAGIPLVGDAMDYYNLWAGEDLAGRCLTHFDRGLTAFFAVIPFLPSGWATQAVKRMGLENFMGELNVLMAGSLEYSEEMIAGLSKRFDITPEQFIRAQETGEWISNILMTEISVMPEFPKGNKWLKDTAEKFGFPESTLKEYWKTLNKNVTFTGLTDDVQDIVVAADGVVSNQAAESLRKPVDEAAVFERNIEQVAKGQKYLRSLPPEIRDKALKISKQRLEDNLMDVPANRLALAGDASQVKKMSGMVEGHVSTLHELAGDMEVVVVVRNVNPNSTPVIKQGFFTKPMEIKGKSADWGPQAAFLPVDQQFSKLGNPKSAIDLDEIADFKNKVKKCLKNGPCGQTNLVLANGDEVMVWKGKKPIVKRGDKYFDHYTGKALDVKPGDTEPMAVIALTDPKTGELVPVTADYDLLAVGGKGDWQAPELKPGAGYGTELEREFVVRGNESIKKRNNYRGNNLMHHGPETQFVGSSGVFGNDPSVTILDPDFSEPLIVPKCDRECMEKWCKTTGQCGDVKICNKDKPRVPCMQIDPDRLVKDYFHDARMRDNTTLSPNSAWAWGEYNGLAGWSPKVVLDAKTVEETDWVFGQYIMELGVQQMKYKWDKLDLFKLKAAKQAALKATEKLFSCPGETAAGTAQ